MSEQVPSDESSYWQRLRRHPGVPVLFGMAVMAFLAGIAGPKDNGFVRGLVGAGLILVVFGPVVLWTARTQP